MSHRQDLDPYSGNRMHNCKTGLTMYIIYAVVEMIRAVMRIDNNCACRTVAHNRTPTRQMGISHMSRSDYSWMYFYDSCVMMLSYDFDFCRTSSSLGLYIFRKKRHCDY